MTASAKKVHDDIVEKLVGGLREQLRGTACRPFTSDESVETCPGQIRRPDVGVACGPRDPNGAKAELPKLVIEVLSPSTLDFETFKRLEEYKQIESLDYIVSVEPNAPIVCVWRRDDERDWSGAETRGLDGRIEMPEVGVTLALSAIYKSVKFPSRPGLVSTDDEAE